MLKLAHHMTIADFDPELSQALNAEAYRQKNTINLIPSENEASQNVREAMASVLSNKYSEGYPNKRYYQGNAHIDVVEQLAIERAKELFGAEHANVQPLSGSPANYVVMQALLKPGDTILGMDLSAGGHLTHGSPVNFSGKLYDVVSYGVDAETGYLDMDDVRRTAKKHRPKLIISGHSAYPATLDFEAFAEIADEVGAYHFADMSHIAGLVAAGVHPSPVPYADVVSTTTHKTLRGPRGALILCKQEYAKRIDKSVFPGTQGGAHNNQIAAKAVAFKEAMQPEFRTYGQAVVRNAQEMAQRLTERAVPLTTLGTDNHLMLADFTDLLGPGRGGKVANTLESVGIITNKNSVPYETSSPMRPSGIRLGTPMITTQSLGVEHSRAIADCIADIVHDFDDKAVRRTVRSRVEEICVDIDRANP